MAPRLVFNDKISPFAAGKLGGAGLLGVEMVKAAFAGDNLAVFGDLESFCK